MSPRGPQLDAEMKRAADIIEAMPTAHIWVDSGKVGHPKRYASLCGARRAEPPNVTNGKPCTSCATYVPVEPKRTLIGAGWCVRFDDDRWIGPDMETVSDWRQREMFDHDLADLFAKQHGGTVVRVRRFVVRK